MYSACSNIPVSYTHLDVYKRQPPHLSEPNSEKYKSNVFISLFVFLSDA